MDFCADPCSQTLVARGEHQRPLTGGTTLNSSGGAQETSPFEESNAVLIKAPEGSNDYAYGVDQGAAGEY
jgi:nuclear transcription Y subunit beta